MCDREEQSADQNKDLQQEVERLRDKLHHTTTLIHQRDMAIGQLQDQARQKEGQLQQLKLATEEAERQELAAVQELYRTRQRLADEQREVMGHRPHAGDGRQWQSRQSPVSGQQVYRDHGNAPRPPDRGVSQQHRTALGVGVQQIQPNKPAFPVCVSPPPVQPGRDHGQQIGQQSPNHSPVISAAPPPEEVFSSGQRGQTRIPLPRQMTYDGSSTWQSFILPFLSLAAVCGWSEEEKLFRLCNSLRGEAAEYTFTQLTPDVVNCFQLLESAMDARFAEKCTTASYLAQLEARKLQPKEKLAEYVADIQKLVIKGYPTANTATRETIGLRYFIKGLQDPQMAVAVGMQDPKTMEEARTALDMYTSLKEETAKSPRVRVVSIAADKSASNAGHDLCVTESRLQRFREDLQADLSFQFNELKAMLKSGGASSAKKHHVSSDDECYHCHKKGHLANKCPQLSDGEVSDAASDQEN